MIEKTKKLNVTAQKQLKQVKIALVGDSGSGKSTFLSKAITNQNKPNQSTLGVQTGAKMVQNSNGSVTSITVWDFSGKLDFVQIRNQFYKQVDIVLLFCDLSSKNSVQSIQYWLRQAKDNGAGTVIIIGNKSDCKKIDNVDKISKEKGCQYFQISSKSGDGVQQLMKKITSQFK